MTEWILSLLSKRVNRQYQRSRPNNSLFSGLLLCFDYSLFFLTHVILLELPKHVAYIVDGNGRWASRLANSTDSRIDRSFGHTVGANVTVNIVKKTFELGVSFVTVFLFSTENWSRPSQEVQNIIHLLDKYLIDFSAYLKKEKIQLRVIGQKNRFPLHTQHLLDTVGYQSDSSLEQGTESRRILCLALSYGGRDDIVDSCRLLASLAANGKISPNEIDEQMFAKYTQLGRSGIPDPDLLVRTSGERRLSNFLLWNCAYTEFESVPCLCENQIILKNQ